MRGIHGAAEHRLAGMVAAARGRAPRAPRCHRILDPGGTFPPIDVVETSPDRPIEFLAPLGERLGATLARDADSAWIGRAAALVGELPLGEATFDRGLAPGLHAALTAGHIVPTPAVAAANLVQVIALTDRVASWAQAVQARAMAALARPGVAVPIGDLLELATHGGRIGPDGSDPSEVLSDKDFDARYFREVSVSGSQDWDVVIREEATRLAAAEVGTALALLPSTAAGRMSESVELVDLHPRAVDCWLTGRIDRQRVRAFASRTSGLDPSMVEQVEDALLLDGGLRAGSTTCVTLRRRLEREIARRDPAASGRRRTLAREDRGVFVQPGDDGMSRFCADLPAPVALLAHEVMDTVAKGLPAAARAGRTAAQTRADVFGDIVTQLAAFGRVDLRSCRAGRSGTATAAGDPDLHGDPGDHDEHDHPDDHDDAVAVDRLLPVGWEALGASVSVVVDADLFSGCTDDDLGSLQHALLERYGDLPADLARALAVSARRARVWLPGVRTPTPLGDAPPVVPVPTPGAHPDGVAPTDPARVADAVADSLSRFCSTDGTVPIAGAPPRPPDTGRAPGVVPPTGTTPAAQGERETDRVPDGDLQVGHWAYRPDRSTAERVIERDRVCRFPGCRRPARQCDLDHRIPFDEGGPTTFDNLDVLCRFHHRIKTHAGWRAIRLPGNRMRWTSPLGAVFVDEPEVDSDGNGTRARPTGTADRELDPPPF